MVEEEIDKVIKKYNNKKSEYKNYCNFLKEEISKSIKDSNISIVGLQARVKKEDSLKLTLEKKIRESGKDKQRYEPKLYGIQDLIGLRIIFYSDADLLNFETFLFRKIGEALLNRYQKYDQQYEAIHWVVQFTKQQLKEWFSVDESNSKIWSKIRFEIQFSEILSHAFNEFGHDIFYKTPIVGNYNEKKLIELKKKFEDLRISGARKIRADLNKIEQDFKHLLHSSQVFSLERIENLMKSDDENYIYHELNQLLGFYDYTLLTKFTHFDIVKSIRNKIETTIVLDKFLEFINIGEILWVDTEDFIDTFWFLVCKFRDGENRDRIQRFADRVFEFRLLSDDKIHFAPYLSLIKYLQDQDQQSIKQNFDVLEKIFNRFLTLDFRGDRWRSGRSLEIRTGKLNPHQKLAEIRSETVELIISLYKSEKNIQSKINYLNLLENVALPGIGDGEPKQEVQDFLWVQCKIVLQLFIDNFDGLELEEMATCDQLIDRVSKCLPSKKNEIKIQKLKEKLESNEIYKEFRTVYQDQGFEETKEFRERFIAEFQKNEIVLTEKFFTFIKNIPADTKHWQYSTLFQLATDIADKYPETAVKWLEKKLHYKIKENILLGLWRKNKDLGRHHLIKFSKKHPVEALSILEGTRIFDNQVYSAITDTKCVDQKFDVLISCYQELGKNKILEDIKRYNKEHRPIPVWLLNRKDMFKQLIKDLKDDEMKYFTQNLLYHSLSTYDSQYFLKLILDKKPSEFLTYLEKIIQDFSNEKHPPIFTSVENNDILPIVKSISPSIFELFWKKVISDPENYLLQMFVGDFLHNFVPEITEELKNKISELVEFKDKTQVETLLKLLNYYNGNTSIYPILKIIIENPIKEIYQEVNHCLVSIADMIKTQGVDGMLLRYQGIEQQVKNWDVEEAFKKQFEKYIQKIIASEQKSVDEENAQLERM